MAIPSQYESPQQCASSILHTEIELRTWSLAYKLLNCKTPSCHPTVWMSNSNQPMILRNNYLTLNTIKLDWSQFFTRTTGITSWNSSMLSTWLLLVWEICGDCSIPQLKSQVLNSILSLEIVDVHYWGLLL